MRKKCGRFEGKQLVSTEEMCRKLRAMLAARQDPDFFIVARTDAISSTWRAPRAQLPRLSPVAGRGSRRLPATGEASGGGRALPPAEPRSGTPASYDVTAPI